MARYSEKDPGKDKKAPAATYATPPKTRAAGTYNTPPPAPAETYTTPKAAAPSGYGQTPAASAALKAEDPGGSCSLTVVVSNEVTGDPIHKAHVDVRGQGFHQSLKTNQQGKARCNDLLPGDYEVEVAPYHGYGSEPKQEPLTLTEKEDAVLHVYLEPEKATLCVQAFYDAKRCGDPEGQIPIKNLRFDVLVGGEIVACDKTGDDGTACLTLNHTGWVAVRPARGVQIEGMLLTPADGDYQLAALASGKQAMVPMAYVSGSSGLAVEAVLASDDGESIPLPGVGIALLSKSSGTLAGTTVTSGRRVFFGDLPPGVYILDITPPPPYKGSPVELEDPTQQGVAVVVGSEYPPEPLVLRFHKALCRIVGAVLLEDGREAWEGIQVVLKSLTGNVMQTTKTGPDGGYLFNGVPPGLHLLELVDTKILREKEHWVPDSFSQKVHTKVGSPVPAQPFVLAKDTHTITIRTFDSDGEPLPFTPVDVLTKDGNLIKTYSTGADGVTVVKLDAAGIYRVAYRDEFLEEVVVNSDVAVNIRRRSHHRPGPPSGFGGGETTIDIPYPLITESASMGGGSWGSPAPPSSTDLGQTVQDALRSVLNWRSAGFNGDAKGFVAALNQSFTLTQTQGHTEFTWTPRSYAAVQSGLGALTGAQASIYTRAKVALDQIMPLLAGLYPLLADADPQNVEAMRAIVSSGLTELVNEFGLEGGPRVLRVDDLFRQLTGFGSAATFNPNPELVKGQFDQLATVFGLRRKHVNTIDEEQDLTNFLIIVDYTLGLQQSWLTQRPFFTRGSGSEPFLGTQLVLVERSLSVVAESVREVYMAMDSVFVGKEERQVVELTFPPFTGDTGPSSLFVSELLGWIDQVASNEGPQLLKDGGKQGVISFQPTVQRLAFLARNALLPFQTAPNLPKGYRTARVQNALAELADHLNETSSLIDQFPVSDSLGLGA
ncbi:MAG TPA: carboxypeptidase regulatory-like domain-containing protein [Thermoanaerobaculia bacterium]|nr:carboxypeptidase regulatory-like domain-containing protein [Thermoanaerobaculia bacterium]